MLRPTKEYVYGDENGQNVDQLRSVQSSSPKILDGSQQTVVINESQPLAKCSVLYLGTAISSMAQHGIDAIQEPLSRRYPLEREEVVRGIEAWLSIYDNGLQLQFVHDPSVIIIYPIRSLVYCASVRYATRTETGAEFANGWRFVPLDSPAASRLENTGNPPLFTITFRRPRHLPANECHCFVTKTKQAALALVQACFNTYQATGSQQDCSKVPLYFEVDNYGSKNKEIDNEIYITPAPDQAQIIDYQTNTEGAGFFYTTDRVPIGCWQIWEHHKHDSDRSSSSKNRYSSSKSRSGSSTNAPAPNLIRVERIKGVNSGQDVFIRQLRDTNPEEQSSTGSQQVYSNSDYDFRIESQSERELPYEIEHLALRDEHSEEPKKNEDRQRKKRPNETHKNTINNHRHSYDELINSSAPQTTPNFFFHRLVHLFSMVHHYLLI